ncbi:ABC transporter substrate-binding protein [Paenarthrobacter ureafaciens]|jgi:raffinose/stachyose/melibiose transport system substrate-binding protein|uniref:ABC transporter substrate-binding protein n=1 Tax=Paenarthrobacter ureafaciens TaxID=37931 RepID=UPI00140CC4C6|nr:extracellular solute-binding protein [Paenarthrobacter ureafaciens]MCX8456125.1 extracellular solute-binding protein [Paenarthrobacter ureafaciens]MCY0973674.1 extracellular solute-binding protein [Paenarthrobacter ureafaciens]QQQ62748.1 extracellular solute-binding protein [Paenarthrobacter ureafaciens]
MTQHRFRGLKLGVLVIPTAAALALTGCSGSTTASSNGGSKEFSLTFATSNTIESPFQKIGEQYMAAHPDVKITFNAQPNDSYDQTVRTQLQAGNASDIIVTSPGSGTGRSILPLVEANFLEPLDDSAKDLVPVGSEALFGKDGKVYGQAAEMTVVGLVTNETAAKASGVADFPSDFAGLEKQCSTLSSANKSFFALAGSAAPNTGLMAMSLAASRVYADDPKWNEKRANNETKFADSQGWKDSLEAVKKLNDAGCFQKGAAGAGFDAITKGLASGTSLAGFIPAPSWKQLKTAAADSDFSVRALPSAQGSDKGFVYASANYSFSINAASKNKEAAKAFLDWAAQPEQTKAFAEIDGALPVSGLDSYDYASGAYKNVGDLIKDGKYGPLPNSQWPNSAVYDALATGVQGLLTGQKSVDQVLQAMDSAWG